MNGKTPALQDIAPTSICFGCGPNSKNGLKIKSYWDADNTHIIATYTPDSCYVGWESLLYGGITSCLIDCHSNWTVMAHHYRAENREMDTLPRIECVTGSLNVKYLRPIRIGVPLFLKAHIRGEIGRKTRVICKVYANDMLSALGDSIFVRVNIDDILPVTEPRP
ncbi:MAG TPA: PaaI family thioesterase [Gammaproteobacteria bacterium]|jgi:hypothetical protein|nr:PaaI family thioesterase [Gammaproteobacteria bacterium]